MTSKELTCTCVRHDDGSVTTFMCSLHADTDPCLTMSQVTGKRRKGSIIRGRCSNCGWHGKQPREITPENILEAFQAAVESRGADYVYPTQDEDGETKDCRYQEEDGSVGCIIGFTFDYLGIPYNPKWENWIVERVLEDHFGLEDDSLSAVLLRAQKCQDMGDTWGKVVEEASLALKGQLK